MVCNLFEVTPRWGCRVPHIAAARQCGANKLRPFQGRRQAAPRCNTQRATVASCRGVFISWVPARCKMQLRNCKLQEGYSLRGCPPMQDAICNCAIASCRHVKWGVVPSSIVTSLNRLIGNVLSLLTVELDTWALSRLPRQVKTVGGKPRRGFSLLAPMQDAICNCAIASCRGVLIAWVPAGARCNLQLRNCKLQRGIHCVGAGRCNAQHATPTPNPPLFGCLRLTTHR